MTKKDMLEQIKKKGFSVTIKSKIILRAQKNGVIMNGTIYQIFDELFAGRRYVK